MKNTIIFDLDGTLLNTSGDLQASMNEMLDLHGYKHITIPQVLEYIGYGARHFVSKSIGEEHADNLDVCLAEYNRIYAACPNDKSFAYEGIAQLLKELKLLGYKTAIISNKPQDATDAVYEKHLKQFNFDFVYGQRQGYAPKPDRACVDFVLESLGVKTQDAIYVGDSDVDAKTAINAQVDGISVLWGYRTRQKLEQVGATRFANNTKELLDIIKSL